jgi:uncharacterized membrane protein
MGATVLTYVTIYVLCMFKIIFGPTMGYAAGLHPLETVALTVAGMMTTVIIFSFLGERIKKNFLSKYFKPKKVFTKRNRRFVKIWRKYGEIGIAFLTPILLSPPGGTLIAIALGGTPKKTVFYMFIWSVFWSFIITYAMYYSGDEIRSWFGQS